MSQVSPLTTVILNGSLLLTDANLTVQHCILVIESPVTVMVVRIAIPILLALIVVVN